MINQLHAPAGLTLGKNRLTQKVEGSEVVSSLSTTRKPQLLSKLNKISDVKKKSN
jgi:hypothetical protein